MEIILVDGGIIMFAIKKYNISHIQLLRMIKKGKIKENTIIECSDFVEPLIFLKISFKDAALPIPFSWLNLLNDLVSAISFAFKTIFYSFKNSLYIFRCN